MNRLKRTIALDDRTYEALKAYAQLHKVPISAVAGSAIKLFLMEAVRRDERRVRTRHTLQAPFATRNPQVPLQSVLRRMRVQDDA